MSEDRLLIDPHVHVLPPERLGGLMRWIRRGFPGHPVPEDISAEGILSDLRANGVTHFFNLAYPLQPEETEPLNHWNLEFCQRTAGAIPFASLHPETPDKAKVGERALAAGFVGFKFHPFVQRFDPWDPRMDGLYRLLEEATRPLIIHTGFEAFYRRPMPVSGLEAMLDRYPRLPLVFVHMAFPYLEWVFRMLEARPDLYLDATNVLACFRPMFRPMLDVAPGAEKLSGQLLAGLVRHRDRIMYGSDHPAGMGSLEEIYQDLQALPVDDETKTALRARTARGFIERFVPGFDWDRSLAPAKSRKRIDRNSGPR